MVRMTTPICDLGWRAPDFSLPDPDGRMWTLEQCSGERGTLVMFICNHCPYRSGRYRPAGRGYPAVARLRA